MHKYRVHGKADGVDVDVIVTASNASRALRSVELAMYALSSEEIPLVGTGAIQRWIDSKCLLCADEIKGNGDA